MDERLSSIKWEIIKGKKGIRLFVPSWSSAIGKIDSKNYLKFDADKHYFTGEEAVIDFIMVNILLLSSYTLL